MTLSLAADLYQKGDAYRWKFALVAARIVGQYQNGATQELADKINRSVSRVEDLADAGKAWRVLCHHIPREYRDGHGTSVFTHAWRLLKLGIDSEALADALVELEGHRPESVKSHLSGFFGLPEREVKPETWKRRMDDLIAHLDKRVMAEERKEWERCTTYLRGLIERC